MHCTKCGARVPEEAAFCPGCGAAVSSELRPTNDPERETADWMQGRSIGCLGVAGIIIVAALVLSALPDGSNSEQAASSAPAGYTPERIAECQRVIALGEKAGLVRARPQERRIEVDERLWAAVDAGTKRGLMMAVFCAAFRGRPETLDNAVAYGYHSGKRLAMASELGVSFE